MMCIISMEVGKNVVTHLNENAGVVTVLVVAISDSGEVHIDFRAMYLQKLVMHVPLALGGKNEKTVYQNYISQG